jgi:glucose-6-phosphate 1-dehydrogenase
VGGEAQSRRPGPHVLVLGATGDLARRKLYPGLFRLWRAGLMPERFSIICSGRAVPGTELDL